MRDPIRSHILGTSTKHCRRAAWENDMTTECPRCNGSGIYTGWGVCYRCNGRKVVNAAPVAAPQVGRKPSREEMVATSGEALTVAAEAYVWD